MKNKRNKKKFNLKQQHEIVLTLQERKRKFQKDKKDLYINKAVWKSKRKK